jgi:hypothetical protein
VFLTASNQIVNDLRSTQEGIFIPPRSAGLETCSAQRTRSLYMNLGEPEDFVEIDQNLGRLFSADFNQVNKREAAWQALRKLSSMALITGVFVGEYLQLPTPHQIY